MSIQSTIDQGVNNINNMGASLKPLQQPMKVLSGLPTQVLLGPQYDYTGEMSAPSEIGIRLGDGSWGGIQRAIGGIDYYGDALGYGTSTGFAKGAGQEQHPMGLNFFVKTGGTCSNGADMYDYVSTIPTGVPGRLGNEIKKTLGVNLQGLAPGIMDDALAALNPLPMFDAMAGTGFAKCKKISLPVGDINGALRSRNADVTTPWIDTATTKVFYQNGKPYETHWVFDSWISADEYNSTSKTYPIKDAKGNVVESFCGGGPQTGLGEITRTSALLLGALGLGLALVYAAKH
jgi:hypothetical protein